MTRRRLASALLLASLAALLAAGCGTAFRSAADEFERTQPASAWGRQPPPGHVESEKAYVLRALKDPESARFEHAGVARFLAPVSVQDPGVVPAWRSVLMVNAKNSLGGYTGAQAWVFLYRDGILFRVQEPAGRIVSLASVPAGPVR